MKRHDPRPILHCHVGDEWAGDLDKLSGVTGIPKNELLARGIVLLAEKRKAGGIKPMLTYGRVPLHHRIPKEAHRKIKFVKRKTGMSIGRLAEVAISLLCDEPSLIAMAKANLEWRSS